LFLGVLDQKSTLVLRNYLSDWGLFLLNLYSFGALSDFIVGFFIEGFKGSDLILLEGLVPLRENRGVLFFLFLLQEVHIVLNVLSKDVISVFLGVEGSLFFTFLNNLSFLSSHSLSLNVVESWESFVVVGNIDTSINCSFQSSEGSVTSGGSDKSNIQNGFEWSSFFDFILFIDVEDFSISVLNTFVQVSHS